MKRDIPFTSANSCSAPIISSMDLSETFHKEDDVQLTEAEQKEAEQMREDEQLRRRDPVAYQAKMMIERQTAPLRAAQTHANPFPIHSMDPPQPLTARQVLQLPAVTQKSGDATSHPSSAMLQNGPQRAGAAFNNLPSEPHIPLYGADVADKSLFRDNQISTTSTGSQNKGLSTVESSEHSVQVEPAITQDSESSIPDTGVPHATARPSNDATTYINGSERSGEQEKGQSHKRKRTPPTIGLDISRPQDITPGHPALQRLLERESGR